MSANMGTSGAPAEPLSNKERADILKCVSAALPALAPLVKGLSPAMRDCFGLILIASASGHDKNHDAIGFATEVLIRQIEVHRSFQRAHSATVLRLVPRAAS